MSAEHSDNRAPLRSIHVDLAERSITFSTDTQATKLLLTPQGILYQLLQGVAITERAVERLVDEADQDGEEDTASAEREPTVTLSGRLKSKPKQGRADGRGNPTAWARFAAHEEGRKEAHFYLATFHRHTAEIALRLPLDAAITVQGFPHPRSAADRMDTLSVVNIVRYTGKPRGGEPSE